MSALSALKWITATAVQHTNPNQNRRNKLADKIDEQIKLATAQMNGESYSPRKLKKIVNPATGESTQVETPKRIKAWWWPADNGKLLLSIRYGSKRLEWAKGKNAVEVADLSGVVDALNIIKQAALNGELDATIEAVSRQLRQGFTQ